MKKLGGLGYILKVEELSTVKDNTLANTLVLENSSPFPGYHGSNIPLDTKPHYLFFITDHKYQGDEIIRKACEIRRTFPHRFDASFGETTIQNETLHFIRIKDLESFTFISGLQQQFIDKGIKFYKKKSIRDQAIIKVYKHFSLDEIAENIFRDTDNPMMFYLKMPTKPTWEAFEKSTAFIKQNVEIYNFDSALGILYGKTITDMIRLFTKNPGIELLTDIRNKYLTELDRIS
jgi:hypothetical protein